jgi:hypothetical protein
MVEHDAGLAQLARRPPSVRSRAFAAAARGACAGGRRPSTSSSTYSLSAEPVSTETIFSRSSGFSSAGSAAM